MSVVDFINRFRPLRPVFKTRTGAIAAALIVVGGGVTGALTFIAQQSGDASLGFVTSIASLLFAVLMLVFVVPPLARASRYETRRIDLPVRLTLGGVGFLSVTMLVAFAAWITGNNLLFFVVSVFVSILFVSWIAARESLRDVAIAVRFPDYIFAGEATPVAVTLNNRKRFLPTVSTFIEARRAREVTTHIEPLRLSWRRGAQADRVMQARRVKRTVRDKQPLAYFAYLPRRASQQQTFYVTFDLRGRITVGGFDVATSFPFGLLRVRKRLRTRDIQLTVFPQLENTSEFMLAGEAQRKRETAPASPRGESAELYSLRRYTPNDDRRRIAWKASARSGKLMVREYVAEDEPRITVWLDPTRYTSRAQSEDDKVNRASKRAKREKIKDKSPCEFERAVSLAAALVLRFADSREQVRLMVDADLSTDFVSGNSRAFELLQILASIEARDENSDDKSFWDAARNFDFEHDASRIIIVTAAPVELVPPEIYRYAEVVNAR